MEKPQISQMFVEQRRPSVLSRSRRRLNTLIERDSLQGGRDSSMEHSPLVCSEQSIYELKSMQQTNNSIPREGLRCPPDMEIQQPRKSFAGLRNTVYDIQSLPERATSIRSKGLRAFLNIRISGLKDRLSIEEKTRDQNGGSTWLRKLAGSMERPKSRAFVAGPTTSCEKAIGSTPDRVSTQDSALEPPRSTFNPGSGAAARAAAAASNERLSPMRAMSVRLDSRVRDSRLTKDSESGIGIDFRDRTADGKENDSSIVKIGRLRPALCHCSHH